MSEVRFRMSSVVDTAQGTHTAVPLYPLVPTSLALLRFTGCDVVLLIDYIGSFTFPSEWAEELRAAGAEATPRIEQWHHQGPHETQL
eukprot:1988627-Amphidinium_carterae.1